MNKVLIALLTGIVVGILVAPDKGSRTREKLSDTFDDLADKLSDLKQKFTPATESMEEPVFRATIISSEV